MNTSGSQDQLDDQFPSNRIPHSIGSCMSSLLEAAIKDARSLDRDKYRPLSIAWHQADEDGKCEVCLAGSMIAGTLQSPPSKTLTPYRFSGNTPRLLETVDYMRGGQWVAAFRRFHGRDPGRFSSFRLSELPRPTNTNFVGWHSFRSHLDSLELILPALREIEQSEFAD